MMVRQREGERCEEARAELALALMGEWGIALGPVAHHLATCAACRRAAQRLTRAADRLTLLAPALPPPAELKERVLWAAVAAAGAAQAQAGSSGPPWWRASFSSP